jgi:diguanylate cyclase (GGDEF)-like protein
VPTANPAKILIVDDDPIVIRLVGRMIAPLGQVQFATNGNDALALMKVFRPDVVLLDVQLPGISGRQVCRLIKSDPELADITVIFVTANTDPEFEVSCFTLGAVDYVQKPVHAPVLLARLKTHIRLKQLSDRLRHSANVDALTDLANRRVFDETLMNEWKRALRNNQPLSLLLIDIDHFKAFNDHYGHPAGDTCLRTIAQTLQKIAVRSSDLAARYGGEEFALVLPDTHAAGAQAVADRLLSQLTDLAIPHAGSPDAECVSASIGLSTFQPTGRPLTRRSEPPPALLSGPTDLLALADLALYDAKRGGRRRTSFRPFQARTPTHEHPS